MPTARNRFFFRISISNAFFEKKQRVEDVGHV
jgi:hypothetical protein